MTAMTTTSTMNCQNEFKRKSAQWHWHWQTLWTAAIYIERLVAMQLFEGLMNTFTGQTPSIGTFHFSLTAGFPFNFLALHCAYCNCCQDGPVWCLQSVPDNWQRSPLVRIMEGDYDYMLVYSCGCPWATQVKVRVVGHRVRKCFAMEVWGTVPSAPEKLSSFSWYCSVALQLTDPQSPAKKLLFEDNSTKQSVLIPLCGDRLLLLIHTLLMVEALLSTFCFPKDITLRAPNLLELLVRLSWVDETATSPTFAASTVFFLFGWLSKYSRILFCVKQTANCE